MWLVRMRCHARGMVVLAGLVAGRHVVHARIAHDGRVGVVAVVGGRRRQRVSYAGRHGIVVCLCLRRVVRVLHAGHHRRTENRRCGRWHGPLCLQREEAPSPCSSCCIELPRLMMMVLRRGSAAALLLLLWWWWLLLLLSIPR